MRTPRPESVELKRVQFDMPPKSVARLKSLMEVTEASSYAEVVKNSLRLYEAIINEVESGGEIYVKKGDKTSQLHIFGG